MKKLKFIFLPFLLIIVLLVISCSKDSEDVFSISNCQSMTIQMAGNTEEKELSNDEINIIIQKINDANFTYNNDDNINGWTYILRYDDVSISFGKYLFVSSGNAPRKNYYSQKQSEIENYLKTLI